MACRWPCLLFAALVWTLPPLSSIGEEIGIRRTKPASGPSVAIEGGFMVPYAMKIPGTEVSFEMAPIPAGSVVVGSPAGENGRSKDEGPQFEVVIEPIWVGKHEVTWAEYKQFMQLYLAFKLFARGGVRRVTDENKVDAVTAPTSLYDPDHVFAYGEGARLPAVMMTQFAARQYTKWLALTTGHFYRLPTEAEWEYAARANSMARYAFPDDERLDDYAWFAKNTGDDGPRNVGEKKPNAFGLYDVHGNVWEWTLDGYDEKGYAMQDGKRLRVWDAVAWPTMKFPRVLRGGDWSASAERCRLAARLASNDPEWQEHDADVPQSPWWLTNEPGYGVGFRIVRGLKMPDDKELRRRVWDADCKELMDDVGGRLTEGRGAEGIVDKELPAAIKELHAKE